MQPRKCAKRGCPIIIKHPRTNQRFCYDRHRWESWREEHILRQILALPEEVVITGAAYQVSLLDNGFGAFLEEVENDVVILQLEGPASIVPAERVTGATRQVDVAGETFYRTDLEAVE